MLSAVKKSLQLPTGYPEFLQELKSRIRGAQIRAGFAVNRELILLYWSVGRDILVRQHAEGWGTKVIDRLAKDLQTEFPGVEGFGPRSLKYMRSFAEAWTEEPIVQQLAAQLPWGHHMVLLDRLKDQPTGRPSPPTLETLKPRSSRMKRTSFPAARPRLRRRKGSSRCVSAPTRPKACLISSPATSPQSN